jgi:outer membrane lipoprotein SlyB
MKTILTKSLLLALAAMLSSCAGGPNARTGTLVGAGAGAVAGNLIGRNNGNAALGTVIGAAAGGAVGNAVGNNADQRNAAAQPLYYDAYGRPVYR